MRISSLNWSCLKVGCLGRASYLNVVNQCCFRPQRIACLASSCCSHAEDLATWPCPSSPRDCVSGGSQCEHSLSWMTHCEQYLPGLPVISVLLVPRAMVIPICVPLLSFCVVRSYCLKVKVSASVFNSRITAWRSRPLLSDFSQANHF